MVILVHARLTRYSKTIQFTLSGERVFVFFLIKIDWNRSRKPRVLILTLWNGWATGDGLLVSNSNVKLITSLASPGVERGCSMHNVLYGKALSRGPTHNLFVYYFDGKVAPFVYTFLLKKAALWYINSLPFHSIHILNPWNIRLMV